MKIKSTLILLAAMAGIVAATLMLRTRHEPAPAVALGNEPVVPPANLPAAPAPESPVAVSNPSSSAPAPAAKIQTPAPVTPRPMSGQKPPIQDPTARAALSFVGADPEAEAYWLQAINDPTLPAEERKDLIEDLNEDGLSDPHHPGPDDMPLIASRIQLIEELAPSAMDRVNADAFNEAYNDLVNLYSGLPAD